MALLQSIAVLVGVTVGAAAMTVTGLNFTADTLTRSIASAPRAKAQVRPNYVAVLPSRQASDLDIAKSVPVSPSGPASQQPPLPSKPTGSPYTVDVNALWVRSGPDKSTERKFSLKRGTALTVTGKQGKWFAVTMPDGRSGWAFGDFLKPAGDGGTTAAAQ